MEKMSEVVAGSAYHKLHHMLSDSAWSKGHLCKELAEDARSCRLSSREAGLLIDESAFAKKGEKSAGVARQWNGRLGKTDNCQVGVFAAIAKGDIAALVDAQLYLTEDWAKDSERCREAGIPAAAQKFRTKGQIALELVRNARRNGLRFGFVGFDGGYGHLPWLLRELDKDGEIFLAEIHSNQQIYLEEPHPHVPERKSSRGAAPTKLVAGADALTVTDWLKSQLESAWQRIRLRGGEKGEVMAEFIKARVYLLDKVEAQPQRYHLWLFGRICGYFWTLRPI
jgi:SRSO17 transposase